MRCCSGGSGAAVAVGSGSQPAATRPAALARTAAARQLQRRTRIALLRASSSTASSVQQEAPARQQQQGGTTTTQLRGLYPASKPHETGTLRVNDGIEHELYYEGEADCAKVEGLRRARRVWSRRCRCAQPPRRCCRCTLRLTPTPHCIPRTQRNQKNSPRQPARRARALPARRPRRRLLAQPRALFRPSAVPRRAPGPARLRALFAARRSS